MNNLDFTSFEVSRVCQQLVEASAQLMGDAAGWMWVCEAIDKAGYMLMELQRRNLGLKTDIECYKDMLERPEELKSFDGAEQRMWVPVDAYLPDENENVLMTIKGKFGEKDVISGVYLDGFDNPFVTTDVIAWRPCPEPWNEVREGNG